jgi:hypothetical protein
MAKRKKLDILHPLTKQKVIIEDTFSPDNLLCPKCMAGKVIQIQITKDREYILQCNKCPEQTWLKKM